MGVAFRNWVRMGMENESEEWEMNFLRSTLEIEPIGFNWFFY